MKDSTTKIASKLLGKRVDGSKVYDPSLIVAVPRQENRSQYQIDSKNLPFIGYDIWHCYEFSCMTKNGIPYSRVMKMKYNCDSEYIVESKSMKLYLNSFNMEHIGNTIQESIELCKDMIEQDLSNALHTTVQVYFQDIDIERVNIFSQFEDMMQKVDESSLKTDIYQETPSLIKINTQSISSEHYLKFSALRSNCRVTHQPDWADIFIYYKSVSEIDISSLIKYLISFRNENHFHEEIVECCYKRLYDILPKDSNIMVSALYTRRGGIDICPTRATDQHSLDIANNLLDLHKYIRGGIKQ